MYVQMVATEGPGRMTQIVRSLLHKRKASTLIITTYPKGRVQRGGPVIPALGKHGQEDPWCSLAL